MTRRVLMMTYSFPPVAGGAIERTLRHVGYLPEFGWEPVVVGPSDPGYRLVDQSTNARIPPDTEVHRAYAPEPAHLRRALRELSASVSRTIEPAGTEPSAPARVHRIGGSMHQRLNEVWAWMVPLIFFPDEQVLWAPAAAAAGMRVFKQTPLDAIYSSSPPVSSHLSAAIVHSLTDLPWIADFRDPWVDNAFARPLPAIHVAIGRALERLIVHAAGRTTFATMALRDAYVRRYPQLERRFVTITNGYDLAELQTIPRRAGADADADGVFRLVYTGAVYGEGELSLFLDGMEGLFTVRPELRGRLRVEFIGSMSPANQRIAAARFRALAPAVTSRPQVSRVEALREVASANAGLLLLAGGADRELFVGAKLYDYIGLDRPILAVAPPGEVRRILEELDWGVSADPTPAGVAMGLDRLLSLPKPSRTADPNRRYERRRLTGQLAALLETLTEAEARPTSGG